MHSGNLLILYLKTAENCRYSLLIDQEGGRFLTQMGVISEKTKTDTPPVGKRNLEKTTKTDTPHSRNDPPKKSNPIPQS